MTWIWIVVGAVLAQVVILVILGVVLIRKATRLVREVGAVGAQAGRGADLVARIGEAPRQ